MKHDIGQQMLPASPDPMHVTFTTRTRHILVDSRHRRLQDDAHNYRIYFGVREEGDFIGEVIKNAVAVNVTSAEIPRTADNIIDGRNELAFSIGDVKYTAKIAPGLYFSEEAIHAALADAMNDAVNDSTAQFMIERSTQNRLRIFYEKKFHVLVSSPAEHTLAFQLGLCTANASVATLTQARGNDPDFDDGFMVQALRFTNLMPRPYVDISIPEVPRAGTKLTNNPSFNHVLARVPLGSTPGGSQHYEPNISQMIKTQFSPITLSYLTIQLSSSDGKPYDSRDTPHTIGLEITYLADPVVQPKPKEPPQKPKDVIVIDPHTSPHGWFSQNKLSVCLLSLGALTTFYAAGRLRDIVQKATANNPPTYPARMHSYQPRPF